MALFRIAHISDLHFGAESNRANVRTYFSGNASTRKLGSPLRSIAAGIQQSTHNLDIALQAAQTILDNRTNLDAVIVSGDLACIGNDVDLRMGRDFLNSPAHPRFQYVNWAAQPTISMVQSEIFILPGNHDRYLDEFGYCGSTRFDSVFHSEWGNPNPFVKTLSLKDKLLDDKIGFVAADFCLQSDSDVVGNSLNRFGQGRAYQNVVSLLVRETERVKLEHPGIGVVWVLHFPPSNKAVVDPRLQLIEPEKVLTAAKECSVSLILAGHIHAPRRLMEDGVEIFVAGSATAFMEPESNWIHFHEIEAATGKVNLQRTTNFRWSETDLRFKLMP